MGQQSFKYMLSKFSQDEDRSTFKLISCRETSLLDQLAFRHRLLILRLTLFLFLSKVYDLRYPHLREHVYSSSPFTTKLLTSYFCLLSLVIMNLF